MTDGAENCISDVFYIMVLSVHVTSADEQDRAQMDTLCKDVQQATGHPVQLACADQGLQGCSGIQGSAKQRHRPADREAARGEKGFRVAAPALGGERSFGWLARFHRLSRDYERLPDVLANCIS
ncbi:transposase [Xanthomonas sp. 3498]|nr:transposase [Xanthomonas sp. 3498]